MAEVGAPSFVIESKPPVGGRILEAACKAAILGCNEGRFFKALELLLLGRDMRPSELKDRLASAGLNLAICDIGTCAPIDDDDTLCVYDMGDSRYVAHPLVEGGGCPAARRVREESIGDMLAAHKVRKAVEYDTLAFDVDTLSANLDDLKSEKRIVDANIGALTDDLDTLSQYRDRVARQIQDAKKLNDASDKALKGFQERIAKTDCLVAKAKKDDEIRRRVLSDVSAANLETELKIEALKKRADELSKSRDDAKRIADELQRVVEFGKDMFRKTLADASKAAALAESELADLNKRTDAKRKEVDAARARRESADKAAANANASAAASSENAAAQQAQADEAAVKAANDIDEAVQRVEELNAERQEKLDRIAAIQEENRGVDADLRAALESGSRLRSELENARRDHDQMLSGMHAIRAQKDALQQQIYDVCGMIQQQHPSHPPQYASQAPSPLPAAAPMQLHQQLQYRRVQQQQQQQLQPQLPHSQQQRPQSHHRPAQR